MKLKISNQFNGSSTFYVTFTADTSLSSYHIIGYIYGRNAVATAGATIAASNVRNNDGTTSSHVCGAAATTGDCVVFPGDGYFMLADQNAFVTVTWGSASTGTLGVFYERISK